MQTEIISLSSKRMLVLDVLRLEENGETFKTGTLETEGARGGVPLDFVRSVNLITTEGRGGGQVIPTKVSVLPSSPLKVHKVIEKLLPHSQDMFYLSKEISNDMDIFYGFVY